MRGLRVRVGVWNGFQMRGLTLIPFRLSIEPQARVRVKVRVRVALPRLDGITLYSLYRVALGRLGIILGRLCGVIIALGR
jgi:hypothetical protein